MKFSGKMWAFAGATILVLNGLVLAAESAKGMNAGMAKGMVRPAEAMTWEAGPAQGVYVAKLWGDMAAGGPFGALLKFDAGLMHPLHSHSQELKLVIVSGTFLHKSEGGTEMKLGPGSYNLQPSGTKHVSGCAPGADCMFFMTSSDKFDMTLVEQAPTKAMPAPKKK